MRPHEGHPLPQPQNACGFFLLPENVSQAPIYPLMIRRVHIQRLRTESPPAIPLVLQAAEQAWLLLIFNKEIRAARGRTHLS